MHDEIRQAWRDFAFEMEMCFGDDLKQDRAKSDDLVYTYHKLRQSIERDPAARDDSKPEPQP